MSIENTKGPKLTPAEIRADMIAERVRKGLKRPLAEEAVDRQLARDAKPIHLPKTVAARLAGISPEVQQALDQQEQRLDALTERVKALEQPAKAK